MVIPIIERLFLLTKGRKIPCTRKMIPIRHHNTPRQLKEINVRGIIWINIKFWINLPVIPHQDDWVGRYRLPYIIKRCRQKSERRKSTRPWEVCASILLLAAAVAIMYKSKRK